MLFRKTHYKLVRGRLLSSKMNVSYTVSDNHHHIENSTISETNNSDSLQRIPHVFIKDNPWTAVIVVSFLSLSSLMGTAGNVLIILATVTSAKLRKNKESIYFMSLAVSDLYVTIVADPMSIIGKYIYVR